jgi:hypothetical protein
MVEEQPLSPKKIRRVDSRESNLMLKDMFETKDTGTKKVKKGLTTAGTGGGGDSNFIYAPKRSIKKKDFKSRMKLIKPRRT